MPPQLKPEAPEVRCKQPLAPPAPPAPRSDEWVEWLPKVDGTGTARLSEKAVAWTLDMYTTIRVLEGTRKIEHDCLDALEKKNLIRQ